MRCRGRARAGDPDETNQKRYNKAVTALIRDWGSRQLPRKWENGRVFETKDASYAVDFLAGFDQGSPAREISPLSLDRLLVADHISIRKDCQAAVETGLGAPVVGQIMRSEAVAKKHPLLPLNGANLTLTAVLEFDDAAKAGTSGKGPRHARLRLYNPLAFANPSAGHPRIKAAGKDGREEAVYEGAPLVMGRNRNATLAANYTASRELALNDGFLTRFSFLGLFMPGKTLDKSGLYLLDPYDPKRIPVVFVHGLVSDPHIWYNAINAIYCDPELRARFQPWYFLYPTGLGVPYNAKHLRDALQTARDTLDPDHNDPGMNRMVLVSHSMGGLLSRMQTIDSGDAFWRSYFTGRPDQMKLSASVRERIAAPLQFQRQTYVKRLIFIAVPHRGSKLADVSFIYHLSSLIHLPLDTMLLTKELLTGNSKFLEPQIRDWGVYSFLSVGTLSPRHPYLKALNALPIPVPHHSIIGRLGKGPLETSSDGAVPYTSSHLATGSELVVRHWHSCAEKPDVVAEMAQRLKQHLRENGVK